MSSKHATPPGTLYVVATPIGHQDDITLRALTTLKSVDFILAEDTRHSGQLLSLLGINKPIKSFHAFNENTKSESVLDLIVQGQSAALISDAGTPLISDPGYPLVKLARDKEIPVVPIPGPCALITALSAAGIPCDKFTFLGFLPAKQEARKQVLAGVSSWPQTLVLYESTHRILNCIEDIASVFGEDCELILVKELTKIFEQFRPGNTQSVLAWLKEDPSRQKGEFILLIPPRPQPKTSEEINTMLTVLLQELPLKQAVKIAVALTGLSKNTLYEQALALQQSKSL